MQTTKTQNSICTTQSDQDFSNDDIYPKYSDTLTLTRLVLNLLYTE